MNQIKVNPNIINRANKRNYSTKLIPTLNIPQEEIDKRFKFYYNIPQPPQKSQEWLNQRTNYITASAFGHAIAPKWCSYRNELLKNKVSHGKYNTFHGNEATRWGEKYEDVANEIYCYRNKCTVKEFGMIPHPVYPFLGASTDGITSKLINLEIKCPFSRKIKPGDVKPIYWKQMQLQMDVLDLELSHFLECTFNEYPTERDFWVDFNYEGHNNIEKGIIIEYVNMTTKNLDDEPKTMYLYSKVEYCEDQKQMDIWHKQTISKIISSQDKIYIRSHFWILDVCSCVNVIRDREWFKAQVANFVSFWEDVEAYRNNGGLEKLDKDIEINRAKPKRIKVDYPGNKSLTIGSGYDENQLDPGYIVSSSDEEIDEVEKSYNKKQSKQPVGCILNSSDEEE